MVDRAVDRAMSVHVVRTGRLGGRPATPPVDRAVDQVLSWHVACAVLTPFDFRSLCYLSLSLLSSLFLQLANKIKLQIEVGEEMEIDIVYEWVPPICKQFKCFGHVRAPQFN